MRPFLVELKRRCVMEDEVTVGEGVQVHESRERITSEETPDRRGDRMTAGTEARIAVSGLRAMNDPNRSSDEESERTVSVDPVMFRRAMTRDVRPLPSPTPKQVETRMGRAFLVQLNITHAGVPLGFAAYTALWRSLQLNSPLSIPAAIPDVLWVFTAIIAAVLYFLIILRAVKYPHLLKRDFTNNRLTNFFASPAIVTGVLALSVPEFARTDIGLRIIFYTLLLYQTALALYWYGDWLFATGYSLRAVHSTFFMATVEFFVLGALGVDASAPQLARVSFSVGVLFWLLVFIAVFAFLSKTLADAGERPNPTMFLFIAPPAAAAIARIRMVTEMRGDVATDDITWFFTSVTLFLYLLLARLFPQYWARKFSIAWWAYIFPLSTAANLATVLAGNLDAGIVWVIAAFATSIATFMIVIATILTVRKVIEGKVPNDEKAIKAHYQALMDKESPRSPTEEAVGEDGNRPAPNSEAAEQV